MERSAKFWNRVAQRYANSPVSDEASYQRKLQVTREYLKPSMKMVEFGCGTGSTALAHSDYVQHIEANDISSRMIEIAEAKRVKNGIKNVNFRVSSIEDSNIPDNSVDAVLAMSLLHLLEDKESSLGTVYKILKPGGIFVSSTPCLGDTMKFFKYIGPIGTFFGLMPLVKVFNQSELISSIIDAGFSVEYSWSPGKGKAVFIIAKKPTIAG